MAKSNQERNRVTGEKRYVGVTEPIFLYFYFFKDGFYREDRPDLYGNNSKMRKFIDWLEIFDYTGNSRHEMISSLRPPTDMYEQWKYDEERMLTEPDHLPTIGSQGQYIRCARWEWIDPHYTNWMEIGNRVHTDFTTKEYFNLNKDECGFDENELEYFVLKGFDMLSDLTAIRRAEHSDLKMNPNALQMDGGLDRLEAIRDKACAFVVKLQTEERQRVLSDPLELKEREIERLTKENTTLKAANTAATQVPKSPTPPKANQGKQVSFQ